ncbi:S-adenosyl-L-methionine-dependent methyltransferase [Lasiosphaeria ovina]|uniref:S-adenosyl-L-methionine-dependent methyltransferase n=1 Tax=Lasiosphaeria ovina TaxID=92902 RepID=A0AAE0NJP5_9PEZI|nr:S-adenosyl-L-methionine-dependent methyltransferase [Lasiosphaeria ovina]
MAQPDVPTQLDALAQELKDAANGIRAGTISLETGARFKVLEAARAIIGAVEAPTDLLMQWVPSVTQLTAVRLFNQWKVFDAIPTESGSSISYKELAEKVNADVILLVRLAWILVATGVLEQIGTDRIAHTRKSKIYIGTNPVTAMVRLIFDDNMPSFMAMPKYFDKFGLKEPTGRLDTVVAFAFDQVGKSAYEVMLDTPERTANFMLAMQSLEVEYPFLGTYDLSWAVPAAGDTSDRPLVVDVGGGKGQSIKAIVKATPGLPVSRCVVEDLPDVVAEAKAIDDPELAGVSYVGMDFHAEQPVKGALVYFIRRCLHNYGDDDSVGILKKIADAMAPDSRLLIVEQVMTNPPNHYSSGFDIFMATIGGKERTYDIFEDIAARAGLKILSLSRNPGNDVGTVECVKA